MCLRSNLPCIPPSSLVPCLPIYTLSSPSCSKKPFKNPFGLQKKLLRRVLRRRLLRRLDQSMSQAQTALGGKDNECDAKNSKNNNEGGKGDTQCASKCCLRKGDTTVDAKGKSRKNTCLKSDENITLHSLGADVQCRCKVYGVRCTVLLHQPLPSPALVPHIALSQHAPHVPRPGMMLCRAALAGIVLRPTSCSLASPYLPPVLSTFRYRPCRVHLQQLRSQLLQQQASMHEAGVQEGRGTVHGRLRVRRQPVLYYKGASAPVVRSALGVLCDAHHMRQEGYARLGPAWRGTVQVRPRVQGKIEGENTNRLKIARAVICHVLEPPSRPLTHHAPRPFPHHTLVRIVVLVQYTTNWYAISLPRLTNPPSLLRRHFPTPPHDALPRTRPMCLAPTVFAGLCPSRPL